MRQPEKSYREGVPSTAAIAGHPLHPVLVPLPIGFWVGALLADLAYWRLDDPFWARAAMWLVGAGVVSGALAAIFGLIDFVTIRRVRSLMAGWVHFLGNVTAVVLSVVSLILRVGNPEGAVVPWGLGLSLVVAGILLVTGWTGGELSYRYLVGVLTEGAHEQRATEEAVGEHQRRTV